MVARKSKGGSNLPVRRSSGTLVKAPTSSQMALVPVRAAAASARWVKRKPLERMPVPVAGGVYATGVFAYAIDLNPLYAEFGAISAAGVAYAATHRLTGDESLGTLAAGAVFAAGSWIAAAAHFGVLWGPYKAMTLAFAFLYLIAYGAYRSNTATLDRIHSRDNQISWSSECAKWKLPNSHLIRREETRLGERLIVNIMGTGQRASALATSSLEEHIAAIHKLPRNRVRIEEGTSADRIAISIRYVDPWKDPIPHPLLVEDHEIKLPESADICDPIAVGQDPESGKPFHVRMYDKEEGANRTMVVATSGGGKTVTVNNILERLTACKNVMTCCIDLSKGKEMRRFRNAGALGPSALGSRERKKALAILRFAANTIRYRSELSDITGEATHVPRPGSPAIILVLDEIDELFATNDGIAAAAATELNFIMSKGRSEGIGTILIGQRGTAKWMGGADIRANANQHIILKVDRRNEMMLALGEEALSLPDMSKYGEGHAGVAMVVTKGKPFTIGRTFKLRELTDLDRLAEGRRPSDIEPGLAAALGDSWTKLISGEYDAPTRTPAMVGGAPLPLPEREPHPDALKAWTGGGGDPEDAAEDITDSGRFSDTSDLDRLTELDREFEAALPNDLKAELENAMNRTEENLQKTRDMIADRKEAPPTTPEEEEGLRRSAQERRRQAAAHTVITPEQLVKIQAALSQPGGMSGRALAKETGIGVATLSRFLNKLSLEGRVYKDPPSGPKARWHWRPPAPPATPTDGHGG